MPTIAFDTETYPIVKRGKASTQVVPKLVCMSTHTGQLFAAEDAVDKFMTWLDNEDTIVVGHHVMFDLLVMIRACVELRDVDVGPQVFAACASQRVHDTMIREQLIDIRRGGMYLRGNYSLARLAGAYLGRKAKGKSGAGVWRMRYNELCGRDPDDYPTEAYRYAIEDAQMTYDVYKAQGHHVQNETFQVCADLALHLISAWGLMVDQDEAARLDAHYACVEDKHRRELERAKIIVDGTMKRAAKRQLVAGAFMSIGEAPHETDKGNIKTDRRTLQYLAENGADNPLFDHLMAYNKATKFRSTYLEPLLDAGDFPLCPSYMILVNSGRTSSRGPNIQNFPARPNAEERKRLEVDPNAIIGAHIRGCIVPRPGKVFVAADYSAIEMAALAQVCRNMFGSLTPLGRAINEEQDLHCRVATTLLGCGYNEVVERVAVGDKTACEARQIAKIANYGFAGGASSNTFRVYAKGFGVDIDRATADRAKRAWEAAWTEMPAYFRAINRMQRMQGGDYHVEQHGPYRTRQGWRLRVTDRFTSAANSMFQGLVGDGAKAAAWKLAQACYIDEESPLYDQRVAIFVHDEFVLEADEDKADACGAELSRLMVEGMKLFIPDVRVEADYKVLTERWGK